MRFLKLFLISVVVLFLILLAFSSLLPSHITISRAIDISAQPASIRAKIEDLQQWQSWNTYVQSYQANDFSTTHIVSPKLSITRTALAGDRVHTNWQQAGKSFPGVFRIIPQSTQTTVQWYFEFRFKWYPWEKFGSIIYDKQLGPEMEKSLHNLKDLVEKAP